VECRGGLVLTIANIVDFEKAAMKERVEEGMRRARLQEMTQKGLALDWGPSPF